MFNCLQKCIDIFSVYNDYFELFCSFSFRRLENNMITEIDIQFCKQMLHLKYMYVYAFVLI